MSSFEQNVEFSTSSSTPILNYTENLNNGIAAFQNSNSKTRDLQMLPSSSKRLKKPTLTFEEKLKRIKKSNAQCQAEKRAHSLAIENSHQRNDELIQTLKTECIVNNNHEEAFKKLVKEYSWMPKRKKACVQRNMDSQVVSTTVNTNSVETTTPSSTVIFNTLQTPANHVNMVNNADVNINGTPPYTNIGQYQNHQDNYVSYEETPLSETLTPSETVVRDGHFELLAQNFDFNLFDYIGEEVPDNNTSNLYNDATNVNEMAQFLDDVGDKNMNNNNFHVVPSKPKRPRIQKFKKHFTPGQPCSNETTKHMFLRNRNPSRSATYIDIKPLSAVKEDYYDLPSLSPQKMLTL